METLKNLTNEDKLNLILFNPIYLMDLEEIKIKNFTKHNAGDEEDYAAWQDSIGRNIEQPDVTEIFAAFYEAWLLYRENDKPNAPKANWLHYLRKMEELQNSLQPKYKSISKFISELGNRKTPQTKESPDGWGERFC